MKKGLLLLMAGVMAFGVAAQSLASARLDSMASNPKAIEDYDIIWSYANKVLDYKNTVDFRLNGGASTTSAFGGGTGEWGGLLIEEENLGGVIGLYVNRPNRKYTTAQALGGIGGDLARYYWYYIGGGATSGGPQGIVNYSQPWNILDVFYATELEGANLGFQVNYGDNGVGPASVETMVLGINAALGFKDLGPFNEGNIRAGYGMFKWTEANGDTDNGISTISVGGLFSADAGNDTAIRLSADVAINNADETDEDGEKQSDIAALLGLACNHKVNGGKGLISSGLQFSWIGGSYDAGTAFAYNAWHLLWNASLEAGVTNWLTLRAGIQRSIMATAYYEGGPTYFSTGGGTAFTTGLGVTWQNFTIDGVINVTSLENFLNSPNAGAGIFYPGTAGSTFQGIVALSEIDMKYKF